MPSGVSHARGGDVAGGGRPVVAGRPAGRRRASGMVGEVGDAHGTSRRPRSSVEGGADVDADVDRALDADGGEVGRARPSGDRRRRRRRRRRRSERLGDGDGLLAVDRVARAEAGDRRRRLARERVGDRRRVVADRPGRRRQAGDLEEVLGERDARREHGRRPDRGEEHRRAVAGGGHGVDAPAQGLEVLAPAVRRERSVGGRRAPAAAIGSMTFGNSREPGQRRPAGVDVALAGGAGRGDALGERGRSATAAGTRRRPRSPGTTPTPRRPARRCSARRTTSRRPGRGRRRGATPASRIDCVLRPTRRPSSVASAPRRWSWGRTVTASAPAIPAAKQATVERSAFTHGS